MMASPEHCTITTRLRRFSSCDGQHPACTEYDSDSNYFDHHFKAMFYANGSCAEDEGHVSIIFNGIHSNYWLHYLPESLSCTASVIDASGSERFSQSIAFHQDAQSKKQDTDTFFEKFGFHRFVKRSTLLNDPLELLPDDCLTLRLEIDYEVKRPIKYTTHGFHLENDRCCLRTNSDFVRDLCNMSAVFRSMLESPMAEKVTGSASIPPEEYKSLMLVFAFLSDYELHASLPELYDLYIFADKYDMQEIVHLSHQLLMTAMRTAINSHKILDYVEKGFHMISELAEKFDDQTLKDILKFHSYIKNKFKGGSGLLEFPDDVNLETGFDCRLVEGRTSVSLFFTNMRRENLQSDSFK